MEKVYLLFCVVCLPLLVRLDSCNNICEWSSWSSWSECSLTCGGYGTQERSRLLCCEDGLNLTECLQDCDKDYNDFNESSQCDSTSCSNGGAWAEHECDCLWNYEGSCCESERPHVSEPTSGISCSSGICNWTPWESWSSCSVTCGGGGTQQRERYLCCPDGYGYSSCQSRCGISPDISRFENRSCGDTCLYGGTIKPDHWGCDCLDRTFGHCCEEVLPGCLPFPTDVIFVLDSSVSQTKEQFTRQLEFVKTFIDKVNISYTEFQISVITFSWEAKIEITFTQSTSREALKALVGEIKFRPGATYTHKGLRVAMDVARKSERRKGMVTFSYVIVLTDGMSTDRTETKAAAKELKALNLRVIAIGIGEQVSQQELRDISSPGDSNNPSYVFSVGDFNALDTMLKQLVHATCDECIRSYLSDVMFLIDDEILTNVELQTVVDAMTYIANEMKNFQKDNGVRVGIIRTSMELRTVISPNETKTLDEFLIFLQTLSANTDNKVCEKIDTACETANITTSINYTLGELKIYQRDNARQFVIIFTPGRFQNINDVKEEVANLRDKSNVKLFTIGPGLDVNMEGLLSLVDEANHVYIIRENTDLSNLDILQTEFSYNTCTKD